MSVAIFFTNTSISTMDHKFCLLIATDSPAFFNRFTLGIENFGASLCPITFKLPFAIDGCNTISVS